MSERLEWLLPIVTVSEANKKEHWSVSSKRHKNQQRTLRILLPKDNYPIPCIITLTRMGGRKIDDDNLPVSMKYCRDEISDIILGNVYQKGIGLTQKRLKGRNDDNPLVEWRYAQEAGLFKGIRISILPLPPVSCTKIPSN